MRFPKWFQFQTKEKRTKRKDTITQILPGFYSMQTQSCTEQCAYNPLLHIQYRTCKFASCCAWLSIFSLQQTSQNKEKEKRRRKMQQRMENRKKISKLKEGEWWNLILIHYEQARSNPLTPPQPPFPLNYSTSPFSWVRCRNIYKVQERSLNRFFSEKERVASQLLA